MIGNIAQHRGGSATSIASQPLSRKRNTPCRAAEQVDRDGSSAVEVAIIGDGKHGLAVGACLAASGHNVRLWMSQGRPPQSCEFVRRHDRTKKFQQALHFGRLERDLGSAVLAAEALVVCGQSAGYGAIAAQLAKVLSNGQTLLLPDAPLCAALQFAAELERAGCDCQVNIGEMGKLFDSLNLDGESLVLSEPRERISICGRTRNETRRVLAAASKLWGGLVPASNLLEHGFADVERLIDPVLWLFYAVGFQEREAIVSPLASPALVSVVSRIADEVNALAAACSVGFIGVEQVLRDYAGLKAGSLPQAVSEMAEQLFSNQPRAGVKGLDIVESLAVDVTETHVALSNLALVARVPVPIIDSVIELASCVTHRELRKEGRGQHQLGLVGLDLNEIVEAVNS